MAIIIGSVTSPILPIKLVITFEYEFPVHSLIYSCFEYSSKKTQGQRPGSYGGLEKGLVKQSMMRTWEHKSAPGSLFTCTISVLVKSELNDVGNS